MDLHDTRTAAIRRRGPRVLVAAAALGMSSVMAGCAASPDEPSDGELTAVVVSEQDQFMFGISGGEADIYTDVVVLTERELVDFYAATWPDKEPPQPFTYRNIRVDLPVRELATLSIGGEPAPGPAMGSVSQARTRIPWSGEPRYLCFGNTNGGVLSTDGCVLVEQQPPAAVTVHVNYGGLNLDQ